MALFGRAYRLDQGPMKLEEPPKQGGTEQVRQIGGFMAPWSRKNLPRSLQVIGAGLQQIGDNRGQLSQFSANEAEQQARDMAMRAYEQRTMDAKQDRGLAMEDRANTERAIETLEPSLQPFARMAPEAFAESRFRAPAASYGDLERIDGRLGQRNRTTGQYDWAPQTSGGAAMGDSQFSMLSPADREQMGLPPGSYQQNNATGQVSVVGRTRGQYTDGASAAAQFASRMGASHSTLTQLENSGVDRTGVYVARYAGGSQDERRVRQAQREFVNAILRRESGAVISPEEFASAELQYFPVPGDGPEVIEQKRQARLRSLQGLINASQGAYEEWYGEGSGGEAPPVPPPAPPPGSSIGAMVGARGAPQSSARIGATRLPGGFSQDEFNALSPEDQRRLLDLLRAQ